MNGSTFFKGRQGLHYAHEGHLFCFRSPAFGIK